MILKSPSAPPPQLQCCCPVTGSPHRISGVLCTFRWALRIHCGFPNVCWLVPLEDCLLEYFDCCKKCDHQYKTNELLEFFRRYFPKTFILPYFRMQAVITYLGDLQPIVSSVCPVCLLFVHLQPRHQREGKGQVQVQFTDRVKGSGQALMPAADLWILNI